MPLDYTNKNWKSEEGYDAVSLADGRAAYKTPDGRLIDGSGAHIDMAGADLNQPTAPSGNPSGPAPLPGNTQPNQNPSYGPAAPVGSSGGGGGVMGGSGVAGPSMAQPSYPPPQFPAWGNQSPGWNDRVGGPIPGGGGMMNGPGGGFGPGSAEDLRRYGPVAGQWPGEGSGPAPFTPPTPPFAGSPIGADRYSTNVGQSVIDNYRKALQASGAQSLSADDPRLHQVYQQAGLSQEAARHAAQQAADFYKQTGRAMTPDEVGQMVNHHLQEDAFRGPRQHTMPVHGRPVQPYVPATGFTPRPAPPNGGGWQ